MAEVVRHGGLSAGWEACRIATEQAGVSVYNLT